MVSQLCLMCGSTLNCQTLCLGARPRYSLVVDEDVKKPTNQSINHSYLVYRWHFLHLFSSVAGTRLASGAAMYGRTVEIPSDWGLEQPGVEFSIEYYHNCEKEELCTGNYFSVEKETGKMILKLGSVNCNFPYLSVTMESQTYTHYVALFQLNCKYA